MAHRAWTERGGDRLGRAAPTTLTEAVGMTGGCHGGATGAGPWNTAGPDHLARYLSDRALRSDRHQYHRIQSRAADLGLLRQSLKGFWLQTRSRSVLLRSGHPRAAGWGLGPRADAWGSLDHAPGTRH